MQKLFLAMAIAIVTATAVSAQENAITVSPVQTDKDDGYEGNSAIRCGIRFNIQLSGVTKIELESVDGNPLAGKAQAPLSLSRLPTNPASRPERIIISPLCLATFTADTGFLFTKMASWLIILVFIRQLYWEHL